MWFGKNSDREPGEAQLVEHHRASSFPAGAELACTYITIAQVRETNEILISRPFWMWGAEMGANSHGVAIGNQAVFTKLPYDKIGLTGMDLLRLALERASSAAEALDTITSLIAKHGQGGGCGYRNRAFRYHNAFVIADPSEAYILETAGRFWAAKKVTGISTISNALSIGSGFDRISDDAYTFAKSKGWCRSAADFEFARCFGDPRYSYFSGADTRRACTLTGLTTRVASGEGIGFDEFAATLRSHGDLLPTSGRRMLMPCAHASWWPMRHDGQTSGSMISRLSGKGTAHWLTGTSSPCLSVFKPAILGGNILDTGPNAAGQYDPESLFWRHERLHRLVLADYQKYSALFDRERVELESKFCQRGTIDRGVQNDRCSRMWDEHRRAVSNWTDRVLADYKGGAVLSPFQRYWRKQSRLDQFPRGSDVRTAPRTSVVDESVS